MKSHCRFGAFVRLDDIYITRVCDLQVALFCKTMLISHFENAGSDTKPMNFVHVGFILKPGALECVTHA